VYMRGADNVGGELMNDLTQHHQQQQQQQKQKQKQHHHLASSSSSQHDDLWVLDMHHILQGSGQAKGQAKGQRATPNVEP
jgi:hypothetical protein